MYLTLTKILVDGNRNKRSFNENGQQLAVNVIKE